MEINIVGSGKLGRSISHILTNKGIPHTVHGRNFSPKINGIVYLCISENALSSVANTLEYSEDTIVLHASGALGLEVFPPTATQVACLHPIQSFAGPEIQIPTEIPATLLCHPKLTSDAQTAIQEFATTCNFTVHPFLGSRLTYHTTAVLSGNFTTILFSLATELLIKEGYTTEQASDLLYALAAQSLHNAKYGDLQTVLTGPLARRQHDLLQRQQENLGWDATLQNLYGAFVSVAQKRL